MLDRHPFGVTFVLITLSLCVAAVPGFAREPQEDAAPVEVSDPIRIYVFAEAERTEVPPGWNESGESYSGTRSRNYRYDAEQAEDAVEALNRQLQRGDRRQELIMVVDAEAQADLILEVVGTEILHSFTARGATNRDDREPASGVNERLGSRLSQARRERAILAQLRVRNNDFSMTLMGRRQGSILLSPAVVLGATMEQWVEQNYAGLLQIVYGM
jgi:hypothetical protein